MLTVVSYHNDHTKPGVVTCTCNPATLETELPNGEFDTSWGKSPSISGSYNPPVIQHKEWELTEYWDLA